MMQCTVCHKPYIGPKNHYVCTYCGASIESPVDLKKDPDHLRDVLRKGSEDGIWGYRDFFTVPEDAQPLGGKLIPHGTLTGSSTSNRVVCPSAP